MSTNLPTTENGLASLAVTAQEQASNTFFGRPSTEKIKEIILTLAHKQSRILMLSPYDLSIFPEIRVLNASAAQLTVALASARQDYRTEMDLI